MSYSREKEKQTISYPENELKKPRSNGSVEIKTDFQRMADDSPQVRQARDLQRMADDSPQVRQARDLQHKADTFIQTKYKISNPSDSAEKEADRIADEVTGSAPPIKSESKNNVARKKNTGSRTSPTNITGQIDSAVNSGGAPLPSGLKGEMENKMGQDFSHVKVHNDRKAHESAAAINAKAYTRGSDIVFGKGEYNPGGSEGRHLIAHELVHVGQGEKVIIRREENDITNLVNIRTGYTAKQNIFRVVLEFSGRVQDVPTPAYWDNKIIIDIPGSGLSLEDFLEVNNYGIEKIRYAIQPDDSIRVVIDCNSDGLKVSSSGHGSTNSVIFYDISLSAAIQSESISSANNSVQQNSSSSLKYFVIHDTGVGGESLDAYRTGQEGRVHGFIDPSGTFLQTTSFDQPAYGTKMDAFKGHGVGEMIHIELIYDTSLAPTNAQYRKLAEIYNEITGGNNSMIVLPHREVDRGVTGYYRNGVWVKRSGHNDPRNFNFNILYQILQSLYNITIVPGEHGITQERYNYPNQSDMDVNWPPLLSGRPTR